MPRTSVGTISQSTLDNILNAPGVQIGGAKASEPPFDDSVTEKAFQHAVTRLAESLGYSWHHQTISKQSKDGWLDLFLWREATSERPGRILFRELKTNTGRLTAAQVRTIDSLRAAGGDAGVWRPNMWATIVEELRAL